MILYEKLILIIIIISLLINTTMIRHDNMVRKKLYSLEFKNILILIS